MQTLYVYPTSRAIRHAYERYAHRFEGFIPTLMRMDEFEKRVLLVRGASEVDALQRVLFLREAARFERFERLGTHRMLSRFFTQSGDFFKFFEELAGEGVSIEDLADADAYAEFGEHLDILATLLQRYEAILRDKGLYDKALLPRIAEFNDGFVKRFGRIEIFLEGYLTRFETQLLQKVAAATELIVHYTTTRFSDTMRRRFEAMGLTLQEEAYHRIDMTRQRLIECKPVKSATTVRVLSVRERSEQAAAVFALIDEMVQKGHDPKRIAVVTPDETFATMLRRFDRLRNLNVAMGLDVTKEPYYRRVHRLYQNLLSGEAVPETWRDSAKLSVDAFFETLAAFEEPAKAQEEVFSQAKEQFAALFARERMHRHEWLFLWLERLRSVRIDDVGGGQVTVMGVLETRHVTFDAVIIVDFNEGKVPVRSGKDRFLNSSVRAYAGLPTRSDREALQKHYYRRILHQSKEAVLLFCQSDDALPSRFLYELGLSDFTPVDAPLESIYPVTALPKRSDPVFVLDAKSVTWSASRLKTWLVCKRKYYYRYVCRLRETSDDFNEGTFIHRVLEALFKKTEAIEDEAELRRRLHRVLDDHSGHDTVWRYRNALYKKRLEPFIQNQRDHFAQGWRIAHQEMTVEGVIGELTFSGRIDRIDRSTRGVCIVDYKTGYVEPMRKTFDAEKTVDYQMPIYALLSGFDRDTLQATYLKVFEGENVEVTHMRERIEALYAHLETLGKTSEVPAVRCEDVSLCRHCEFRLLCERGEYL